ncbi:MAG: tetratricopeptide repeat protein [Elusimicrobiaceae bacterium]|nr:tetratricopeptide repeat protein [Elusimicrobiaceae bacterium]MBT6715293.1 tetratricopeptide repeat protein [Elusimicrobiaceae bacterium]
MKFIKILTAILLINVSVLSFSQEENKVEPKQEVELEIQLISEQQPVTDLEFLEFYKRKVQTSDKQNSQDILNSMSTWEKVYPQSAKKEVALIIKADIYMKLKKYDFACMNLINHRYFYTTSPYALEVKTYLEQCSHKLNKKLATDLMYISKTPKHLEDKTKSHFYLLETLSKVAPKDLYNPLKIEIENFLATYPTYERNDKLELLFGDLHRENRNYKSAVMQYEKILPFYPDSIYKAASLRLLGDVYAADYKDKDQAFVYYRRVIDEYPNSVELPTAYKHMAMVAQDAKDYDVALKVYDEIIEKYKNNEEALFSYQQKFNIYKIKKLYSEAINVLDDGFEAFSTDDEKGVKFLVTAANFSETHLKNLHQSTQYLIKVVETYPSYYNNPKLTYEIAQNYEKLKDFDSALVYYQKVVDSYSLSPYVKKAQKRINKIVS